MKRTAPSSSAPLTSCHGKYRSSYFILAQILMIDISTPRISLPLTARPPGPERWLSCLSQRDPRLKPSEMGQLCPSKCTREVDPDMNKVRSISSYSWLSSPEISRAEPDYCRIRHHWRCADSLQDRVHMPRCGLH